MSSPSLPSFLSMDADDASTSPPVSPPVAHQRPFRRMSLPVTPNLNLNRQSVASLASFESLSERGASQNSIATKMTKSRRTPMGPRGVRRRGYKPPDKERDTRRRKVIQEFYETERTYVQGLDLIYEVGQFSVNTNTAFSLTLGHLPAISHTHCRCTRHTTPSPRPRRSHIRVLQLH
jgi:hypothetical protein